MQTDRPAAARYAAHVRPLCPPPMMTASKARALLLTQARGDGREAAIDVRDLARDAARQRRQQERGDVAHLVRGHVAAQRRVLLDEVQYLREAGDAGGCERLDGTRGNAV